MRSRVPGPGFRGPGLGCVAPADNAGRDDLMLFILGTRNPGASSLFPFFHICTNGKDIVDSLLNVCSPPKAGLDEVSLERRVE